MINVLIVEDQELPRQYFEMIVNSSGRYRMVRSVSCADMAITCCDNEKIDLILMDVCTSFDSSGLDASAEIKAKYPEIKIIIVTSMPEFSWLSKAKKIGIDSFWYKNVGCEPLLKIMDLTMEGINIFPDNTPEIMLGKITNHDFSFRELEILRELATGASNVQIAEKMKISSDTVKTHIKNLMTKTGFRSRTELAVEAIRLGIVVKEKSR